LIGESKPCQNNLDVGEKEVEEHKDCKILEPTKKGRGGPTQKKTPAKKRAKMMKFEEEDMEEKKRNWLDNDVEQLIAIRGEMFVEFERNAKK
jgi:hypothetical protein